MKTLEAIKKRRLLSKQKEELDFEVKQIKDQIANLDEYIIGGFVDEGIEGMVVDGVNTFIDAGLQYGCLKENREEKLFPWLKEVGLEHLITTIVRDASLNKAIRVAIETGAIDSVPDFVGQFNKKKIKEK